MYNIGDLVVYCSHGVCRIEDIEQRSVDKKLLSYYVLSPLDSEKTKFYIPVHNPLAVSKMRYLLTKDELIQILKDPAVYADCWIPEENRRKMRYKELSVSADFFSLVQMVYALQRYREQQLAAGRKFHLADDNFLRDAKKILESELSVVLQVPASQVQQAVEALL